MQYRLPLFAAVTLTAILALVLAPRLASWLARTRAKKRGDKSYSPPKLHLNTGTVVGCYVTYAINFLMIGCGLWLVADALLPTPSSIPNVIFLTGAFAGSWILGFIAPGAPAGLGIREAILSAWLSGTMPAAQIVVLVIALRIATTSGDLINFSVGSVLMRRQRYAGNADS